MSKFPCDLYEANMCLGSMHGPKSVKPKNQAELDEYTALWVREFAPRLRSFVELQALFNDGTRRCVAKGES